MDNSRPTLISLRDVTMRFDSRTVLEDVSLDIDRGDFIAITGPNGGGKTTLLRIILRLLRPTEGKVVYSGDVAIGYLPQKNQIDSHFPITVREVIASGLINSPLRCETHRRVDEMLTLTGLHDKADASLGQLSGGQMQRALLGRALIASPSLLVLDEPLSYVDKRFEHHIYDIIRDLASTTTILLVSHEMTTIASLATRHIIVDRTIHCCHSHSHFVSYGCDEEE